MSEPGARRCITGNGRMKRGFILTFSALLLVSFLVLFAVFYLEKTQEQEEGILESIAVLRAGFLADDIEADFNRLLGAGVDINRGSSATTITITDRLGYGSNKLLLLDLKEFAEGGLAAAQNVTLDLDVSGMADGRTELEFGNGLQYDYSYADDNVVQLYVPGGNTGITAIDLNITVNAASISAAPWAWQDVTGDITVNLHYVDSNSANRVTHYGKLDSTQNNLYQFTYSGAAGDTFDINVGNVDGNLKAVRLSESIDADGVQAEVWLKVSVNSPSGELGAYWNADLNYSQADVNVNRRVGAGKS